MKNKTRINCIVKTLLFCIALTFYSLLNAEDGYNLWLRYNTISNSGIVKQYSENISEIVVLKESSTITLAKQELTTGVKGLLNITLNEKKSISQKGAIILGTTDALKQYSLENVKTFDFKEPDSYGIYSTIINKQKVIVITSPTDIGVLYGTFHFLRLLETESNIENLDITENPKIKLRILNHWDNPDGSVERGYAGKSLWQWHELPDTISPRYKDYARANASIGINGTVLSNVNANSLLLTPEYLKKTAALANIFRPYGIKVYLTARFSAPIEIGGLKTADPYDSTVVAWWKKKTDEIYKFIPDFGGFLVKANSEGQPGPQNYGRNHADGANMLAKAVAPHGGIVMWRAFVYSHETPTDRALQAYNEFKPLDGKFEKNVFVQVKNGAIDFQPREPFHPLFGAMPQTPLMMEFQITKEYLGFSTHVAYLASLFKEVLNAETYAKGEGSTVAKVIDGSLDNHVLSGIAGVSNIGNDRNWCGGHMEQANWYAFGRLAWNHDLTPEAIADEWLRMTFSNDPKFLGIVKPIMLNSRETVVNYMTPIGLHHIMGWEHHYGPMPWNEKAFRMDWTSAYYHKADSAGIGFNRTPTGSNATGQYFPEIGNKFANINTCPENLLLWFHHVNWDYKMKSGRTVWNELCFKYNEGLDSARSMQSEWTRVKGMIDDVRFVKINTYFIIQANEAKWWHDACLTYFQSKSKKPFPQNIEQPKHDLEFYKNMKVVPFRKELDNTLVY